MTTPMNTVADTLCASLPPQLLKTWRSRVKQIHRSQAPLWTFLEAQASSSIGTTTFFSSSVDELSPVVEEADGGLHCPLMWPVPVTLAWALQIPSVHFSLLSSLEAPSRGRPSVLCSGGGSRWGALVSEGGCVPSLHPCKVTCRWLCVQKEGYFWSRTAQSADLPPALNTWSHHSTAANRSVQMGSLTNLYQTPYL